MLTFKNNFSRWGWFSDHLFCFVFFNNSLAFLFFNTKCYKFSLDCAFSWGWLLRWQTSMPRHHHHHRHDLPLPLFVPYCSTIRSNGFLFFFLFPFTRFYKIVALFLSTSCVSPLHRPRELMSLYVSFLSLQSCIKYV